MKIEFYLVAGYFGIDKSERKKLSCISDLKLFTPPDER